MTNPTPEALIERAVRRLQSARREVWDSEVHPSDGKVHDTDVLAEIRELDELIAALPALATSAPPRYSRDYVADMEGSLQQIANAVGVDMRDGSKTADDIIAAVKRLATSARVEPPAGWKLVQVGAIGSHGELVAGTIFGHLGPIKAGTAVYVLNAAPTAPPAAARQTCGHCGVYASEPCPVSPEDCRDRARTPAAEAALADQLRIDRLNTGTSWVRLYSDGTVERVDPADVMIPAAEAAEPSDQPTNER